MHLNELSSNGLRYVHEITTGKRVKGGFDLRNKFNALSTLFKGAKESAVKLLNWPLCNPLCLPVPPLSEDEEEPTVPTTTTTTTTTGAPQEDGSGKVYILYYYLFLL